MPSPMSNTLQESTESTETPVLEGFKRSSYTLTHAPAWDDQLSTAFMRADLVRSGLTPEDMRAYPLQSGLGLPQYCIEYGDGHMYRIRFDRTADKYTQPRGISAIWTPVGQEFDPASPLFYVEGEKKASRAKLQWPSLNIYGFGGCWNLTKDGKLLPAVIAHVAQLPRDTLGRARLTIIFDGDVNSKISVRRAAHLTQLLLDQQHCDLNIATPPPGYNGLDDWLVANPDGQLNELALVTMDTREAYSKRLGKLLGCSFQIREGDVEKLHLNETNAAKILSHYWGASLVHDRRLGYLLNGTAISHNDLYHDAIKLLQELVNPTYPAGKIKVAFAMALSQVRQADFVREMILATPWDGVKRLETWGSQYLTSNNPRKADDWGRLLMTGLGMRIYEPGIKFDNVCILFGAQGRKKTSFFEELARFGPHKFYQSIDDLTGDALALNTKIQNALIVDLAEGLVFDSSAKGLGRLKAKTGTTNGSYRVIYTGVIVDYLYGHVWAGTTNLPNLLSDPTGSRRTYILEVEDITPPPFDLRLQLLAEVFARRAEFTAESRWYEPQLTMEDIPEEIRAINPHISDVRELLNLSFHKHDSAAETLVENIEDGIFPTYKGHEDAFFCTKLLLERLFPRLEQRIHNILIALARSPTFPYYIANTADVEKLKLLKPPVARPVVNSLVLPGNPEAPVEPVLGPPAASGQYRGYWFLKKPPTGGRAQ